MKSALLLTLVLCFLAACEPIEPADSSSGKYSAQYAQTALEYNLFITKHLNTIAGQLTSRMIAVKNSQSSVSSTELAAAKESLSLIEEEVNVITATQPAKTYESSRETTLATLDVVLEHYRSYIKALEKKEDISSYSGIFQNDFNSVTSLSTLYNN